MAAHRADADAGLAVLEHISHGDFIKQYWQAHDEIVKYLQTRTCGLWAVGIDAVPAGADSARGGIVR